MTVLKILIVDDEKRVRTSVSNVIKLHYPNALVVGEAEDINSAREAIDRLRPDVVLLDIKMPGGTGLDLLRQMSPLNFKVIFITAYDKFAVDAFKFSAIDYLLKPVLPHELVDALHRVEHQLTLEKMNTRLNVYQNNINNSIPAQRKIVLNTHDIMHVLRVDEVIRCEADSNYTKFYLTEKRHVMISRSLKEYEDILIPCGFYRCHHSHLINLSYVDRLEKRDGGTLVLKDGSSVQVSARKYGELVTVINNI